MVSVQKQRMATGAEGEESESGEEREEDRRGDVIKAWSRETSQGILQVV